MLRCRSRYRITPPRLPLFAAKNSGGISGSASRRKKKLRARLRIAAAQRSLQQQQHSVAHICA
jgi:hypothetical protein